MSVSKIRLVEKFNLPLSQFIEKERLKTLSHLHNNLYKGDTFELNKIKEYINEKLIIEKTKFFKDFKIQNIDIDFKQNLLQYPNTKINFLTTKINFTLYSKIYNFHYPNEDCNYLLEDIETNQLIKVNPSDLEDGDIFVQNVS